MKTKSISRRHFLKLTSRGIGLAVVSNGLIACTDTNTESLAPTPISVEFQHGVASGDPTQEAVILWTRVTPTEEGYTGEVLVRWEVATDKAFTDLVTNGAARVSGATDYTLKVDAINLTSGTTYYYRFIAEGVTSSVGTTRTLPEVDVESVTLAVMSCSNYPAGHFNVYDMAAKKPNLDAVLHLGDYIYEYGPEDSAAGDAEKLGRVANPAHEIITLTDYRTRYAQYRTDESLQTLHATVPFIVVWDDHEVANDTWLEGAGNHQEEEGSFEQRKLAALQAYFEWLPIRPVVEGDNEIIHRKFRFGQLVDLYMLDTRVVARAQQLNYGTYLNETTGEIDIDQLNADLYREDRALLGSDQLSWLHDEMSVATATWQVLGQQILMGRMSIPAAIATRQMTIDMYAEFVALTVLKKRAEIGYPPLTDEEQAHLDENEHRLTDRVLTLLQAPHVPYNLDAWDGYAYEREVVLSMAKKLSKNFVVLAGDTHNAWANDLKDSHGDLVGVEFASASVTSPGLESYLSIAPEDVVPTEEWIVNTVDDLKYANANNRGFMTVTFTPEKVSSIWNFVDTIGSTDYKELEERRQCAESLAHNPGIQLT
ncbi:alkaline phosphatase D family protein [Endozoicomonas sp. 4G]|uniref:alkaline phosphatase D family protein n=1 Tax=Endozoicomonas sp. 4G TaxID=2872754 RepID=UPI0020787C30|nr:alkaline phosphatase D family protein [Endozoicomonas sp. 4G]